MKPASRLVLAALGLTATVAAGDITAIPVGAVADAPFRRIASFPVFENTSPEIQTVAEIVAAAEDGNLLVYTDSANEALGFVDITDPANPAANGMVDLAGEPTSVAVLDGYALAAVNTSVDFIDTSGSLEVVDIDTRMIVRSIDLGGQPDSVAISTDGRYAVVAIENERDEDLGDGEPPQLPAGYVVIVDLVGAPADWTTRVVDLVGVADLFPEDPEPEFVAINNRNIAVVTLQENNHIVLIRLSDGSIVDDFTAGTVDLDQIDIVENDLIEQNASLTAVPREPDGVAWLTGTVFATADEGDLFGGSRGFTTFNRYGVPLFGPGNGLDQETARLGHYPEARSENKGCEPEGVVFASYGGNNFLLVGSERSNVVFVYQILGNPARGASNPQLIQTLPTGVGPEGLLAIPERNLFVVACEEDARDDKIRSVLTVFSVDTPNYPTIVSNRRVSGEPIPWGALSALATEPTESELNASTVFAVHDSYYNRSRVYTMDIDTDPAVITREIELVDAGGLLLDALVALSMALPETAVDDFDPTDIVNADGSVNLDPEGLTVGPDGTFWLASEGSGNLVAGVSDPGDRPFESPNLVLNVARDGTILDVILLPQDLIENQLRFGFEGVAVTGEAGSEVLYVAFQREWGAAGDPDDRVRIGRFDTTTDEWTFAYYGIEPPTSPNGGWVGLSELVHLGGDEFAVLERDDQGGPDAAIKRIYSFSITDVDFKTDDMTPAFDELIKVLRRDLLAEGDFDTTGGLVPEKLEGMALLPSGQMLIVNDNDGVDDNNGETQLLTVDLD